MDCTTRFTSRLNDQSTFRKLIAFPARIKDLILERGVPFIISHYLGASVALLVRGTKSQFPFVRICPSARSLYNFSNSRSELTRFEISSIEI